jgi:hypothetical protein
MDYLIQDEDDADDLENERASLKSVSELLQIEVDGWIDELDARIERLVDRCSQLSRDAFQQPFDHLVSGRA